MKNWLTVIALTAIGVFFFRCKQGTPKQPASTPVVSGADAAHLAKPELFLYVANVDNLRLREQPSQSSGVLAQFREGELLEGNGVESVNREEIELRGIPIEAPYVEVRATPAGKKSGWVFGGALICVYAGPAGAAPDHARVSSCATFLKSLNPKDINSGAKAWNFIEKQFADAQNSLADAVIILLERFLRRMENEGEFYKLTEKIAWADADIQAVYDGNFDMGKYPLTQSVVANGFRLAASEGSVFPIADLRKMQAFFGPKVSRSMKAYLDQSVVEQNEPVFDDGGVVVPMEKIADMAAFWEQFNRENPYFPMEEECAQSERWLRNLLVGGASNTPVFNYETDEISEDFKNVWSYVQQKYPDTKFAKACKQLADLCAAEGWKRTKKVEDLIISLHAE